MIRVRFRNGPNAPPGSVLLPEEFDSVAEAEEALPRLVHMYGTVPEASAWLEGDEEPVSAEATPEQEPEPEPEKPSEPEPAAEPEPEPEPPKKPARKPRRRS